MSSFAGNDILISPEGLISDGLLSADDAKSNFPSDVVDYEAVVPFKTHLLQIAWRNFQGRNRDVLRKDYEKFCNDHEHWLEDYGLFRAQARFRAVLKM